MPTAKLEKQNPWISLLRIFMCLAVIQDHFPTNHDTVIEKFISFFGGIAVPCFMFLSFYLMANDLKTLNKERIKTRIWRLYAPVLFWSFAYFISINAMSFILGKADARIGINALLMNLLFSHCESLTMHMWFLIDQIIDLILIVIILSYTGSGKKGVAGLLAILFITFVLEYRGVVLDMFSTAPLETRNPLGRSIECIPYAVCGILYAWNIHNRSMKIKGMTWLFIMVLTVLSMKYVPHISGFGYQGVYLTVGSAAICILVMILPDFIRGRLRIAINWLGSCTMGIYCLHWILGRMMNFFWPNGMYQGTLIFDGIIFCAGVMITMVIRCASKKIGWKWLTYVS